MEKEIVIHEGEEIKEVEVIRNIKESIGIIRQNESMVEMGIFQIGNELKYIRDNKTYQDAGINTFEEFCETGLKYGRRQAYKFIEIAEKFSVPTLAQIGNVGMTKLLSLAKLDEEERSEVIGNKDLKQMTVKEVEEMTREIKRLKKLNAEKDEIIGQEKKEKKQITETLELVKRNSIKHTKQFNMMEDSFLKIVKMYNENVFSMPAFDLEGEEKKQMKKNMIELGGYVRRWLEAVEKTYGIGE